ncbi:50S ribosomal protein L11 methyltransferase [Peptoniphilus indolicus]|uniref:Ribosomal protein L11 methyltransferase n=2 Tax=Peptoniphilus indolicus TaxID=33030 RepID=G4D4H9_9FIRM|nr:50S ribosomal protein L11 methyltransferase [Peptoniphilus indolicus]EGY79526.1 ribosomal protein L11 methyltransferase [Peptoniphilus indolicus ATCC 29427]SUB75999.1 Ribosomal protein L11 methyltransferase [Peptoniphilus indolicus]
MKYIELILKAKDENRDNILNTLYDNEIYIFEEEGKEIIEELDKIEKDWDFVDERILNLEPGMRTFKVYFQESESEVVEKLKTDLGTFGELEINEIDDEDWANNWKKYYEPVEVGDSLVIIPSWLEYNGSHTNKIYIEPGMAFGTGTHETTYMCLEALEDYVIEDDVVFDIGCGSGILGVAATNLGAKKIVAVDIDSKCTQVSKENAILNNVEDKIEIHTANLLDVVSGKADIIVSNIIAEIIAEMVPDLKAHLEDDGLFISSGIIVEKIYMVENALIENGFEIIEKREKNGWALLVGRICTDSSEN